MSTAHEAGVATSIPTARVVIEFDGVGRTYPGPPAVEALRSTDLIVRDRDYVTVVGPSGSGKSTFLNVLGLLDRPTSGSYELDGIATEKMSEAARAGLRGQRLGMVFQAYHLLPLRTAAENVELGLLYAGVARSRRATRAREALERVGLSARADALAGRLSGGEKQRTAIARALVNEPAVLLCDEPTGNLDTANAATVLELLDQLNRHGTTLMVITHDRDVAARGRRLLTIIDGVVSEPHHAGREVQ